MKTHKETLQWLKGGKLILNHLNGKDLRLVDGNGCLTPHRYSQETFDKLDQDGMIQGTGCYAGSPNQYYKLMLPEASKPTPDEFDYNRNETWQSNLKRFVR